MKRFSVLRLSTLLIFTTLLIFAKFEIPFYDEYIQSYTRFSSDHDSPKIVVLEDTLPYDAAKRSLIIAAKLNYTVLNEAELEMLSELEAECFVFAL